jgi:hypothetical protein
MTEEQKEPGEKTVADALAEMAPGDAAAKLYSTLLHQFELQLPQVRSRKGLLRIIETLIKAPLENIPRITDKLEANVYMLADRLLQCKFIMIAEVMNEELNKEPKETENVGSKT